MRTRILLLSLSITTASVALADDNDLRRCRLIADAAARLACYDALPLPMPGQGNANQAQPAGGQGEARQAGPAVAPEQFGFEQQFLSPGSQSIESTIPGRFLGWGPNAKIRLANGQVWQITDDSKRAFSLTDPKVTVRRGLFGAYYLEFAGSNATPKVRRVE